MPVPRPETEPPAVPAELARLLGSPDAAQRLYNSWLENMRWIGPSGSLANDYSLQSPTGATVFGQMAQVMLGNANAYRGYYGRERHYTDAELRQAGDIADALYKRYIGTPL
jgi:hypothetical protein